MLRFQFPGFSGVEPPAVDFVHSGSTLPLRDTARSDVRLAVLDVGALGATPLVRSSTRLGLVPVFCLFLLAYILIFVNEYASSFKYLVRLVTCD